MAFEITLAIGLIILGSHLAIYEVVDFARSLTSSMGLNPMLMRAVGIVAMAVGFWLLYPAGGSAS
jgi:predicted permease